MLTQNLWVERGLVNGTTGVIHDIVWHKDAEDVFKTLPRMLLIKFKGYTGPGLFEHDGMPVLPILPALREWEKRRRNAV